MAWSLLSIHGKSQEPGCVIAFAETVTLLEVHSGHHADQCEQSDSPLTSSPVHSRANKSQVFSSLECHPHSSLRDSKKSRTIVRVVRVPVASRHCKPASLPLEAPGYRKDAPFAEQSDYVNVKPHVACLHRKCSCTDV